jgi:alginate O-acetyltransferase complex protein AlgI
MQLYFDFSAYSDMAIGLGRVFGFTYKENFDHPYLSASITEFWRRWHMSLSAFFRDYVYIPLGGNRRGTARTILNLAIVWSLTGLWHGASWNFVLWGGYYFVLLVLERFVLEGVLNRIPVALRHVMTLLLVIVGWVIFYYTDFGAMTEHLKALIGLGSQGLTDPKLLAVLKKYTVLPLIMAVCCLPLEAWLKKLFSSGPRALATWGAVLGAVALTAIFLLSILFLMGQTYNPFIYFRF